MQPLKSREKPSSPIEAAAIALLRSAEPYQPPAGLKQRVRLRLLLAPSRRLPRVRSLRLALIVGCILIAAGASAAIGGRWLLRSRNPLDNTRLEPAAASQLKSKLNASLGAATETSASAPAAAVAYTSAPVNSASALDTPPAASAAKRTEATPATRPEASVRATPSSEKELVFDAMRALRREGQPERAARLLDEYMRRYPRGSLAEEALALAIEAASALGEPRARALADRYLTSFPAGRFRAAALRARSRFSQ